MATVWGGMRRVPGDPGRRPRDRTGCGAAQLCPCDASVSRCQWQNQAEYLGCVAKAGRSCTAPDSCRLPGGATCCSAPCGQAAVGPSSRFGEAGVAAARGVTAPFPTPLARIHFRFVPRSRGSIRPPTWWRRSGNRGPWWIEAHVEVHDCRAANQPVHKFPHRFTYGAVS